MTEKVFCYHCRVHHPPEVMGRYETRKGARWRCLRTIAAAKPRLQHGHQDPLSDYRAAVGKLHLKLGQISTNSHQTCSHLSKAAAALRSMARRETK
jgi:hypothetical protein